MERAEPSPQAATQRSGISSDEGGTAMSEHMSNEKLRKEAAAQLWLSYYNRVLYEKGIITERERNQMKLKIDKWQMPQQML